METLIIIIIVELIVGLILFLINRRISKKMQKLESEMNEQDFVMTPAKWIRVLGIIGIVFSLAIAIGIFIETTEIFMILLFCLFLGFAVVCFWLFLWATVEKTIVQGNMITAHELFGKVYHYTFAEIARAKWNSLTTEIKCYDANDDLMLEFSSFHVGYPLMFQRLRDIGKIPWFSVSPALKENKKQLKRFLTAMTSLMNFLIENDLTSWNEFDKNGIVPADMKVYKHQLTEKGQYLVTSGAIGKWLDFAEQGGDISDFRLLEVSLCENENNSL